MTKLAPNENVSVTVSGLSLLKPFVGGGGGGGGGAELTSSRSLIFFQDCFQTNKIASVPRKILSRA